eukprot:3368638-Rhodomonas_salina.1
MVPSGIHSVMLFPVPQSTAPGTTRHCRTHPPRTTPCTAHPDPVQHRCTTRPSPVQHVTTTCLSLD